MPGSKLRCKEDHRRILYPFGDKFGESEETFINKRNYSIWNLEDNGAMNISFYVEHLKTKPPQIYNMSIEPK